MLVTQKGTDVNMRFCLFYILKSFIAFISSTFWYHRFSFPQRRCLCLSPQEQQTPLHIASRLGNVDNVLLLLQHGASPDATMKDLSTPLHIAAKEGHDEVTLVLLEHGASQNLTTKVEVIWSCFTSCVVYHPCICCFILFILFIIAYPLLLSRSSGNWIAVISL